MVNLMSTGTPQILSLKAALHLSSHQHTLVNRAVPPQMQDALIELCEVPGSPFLQTVQVPLDGNATFHHIIHSSQFSVTSIPAESTLCPIIQTIIENVAQEC